MATSQFSSLTWFPWKTTLPLNLLAGIVLRQAQRSSPRRWQRCGRRGGFPLFWRASAATSRQLLTLISSQQPACRSRSHSFWRAALPLGFSWLSFFPHGPRHTGVDRPRVLWQTFLVRVGRLSEHSTSTSEDTRSLGRRANGPTIRLRDTRDAGRSLWSFRVALVRQQPPQEGWQDVFPFSHWVICYHLCPLCSGSSSSRCMNRHPVDEMCPCNCESNDRIPYDHPGRTRQRTHFHHGNLPILSGVTGRRTIIGWCRALPRILLGWVLGCPRATATSQPPAPSGKMIGRSGSRKISLTRCSRNACGPLGHSQARPAVAGIAAARPETPLSKFPQVEV